MGNKRPKKTQISRVERGKETETSEIHAQEGPLHFLGGATPI